MAVRLRNPGIAVTFELNGQRQVIAQLKRLTRQVFDDIGRAINSSALAIDRAAKLRVPVDTGRLRSSIRLVFNKGTFPLVAASVGTDVKYAKFVEFGTAKMGKKTNRQPLPPGYSYGTSHQVPPTAALAGWARRHKLDPWAVAVAIAKRGGNPARPFLFPAFEGERPRLYNRVVKAVQGAARKVAI